VVNANVAGADQRDAEADGDHCEGPLTGGAVPPIRGGRAAAGVEGEAGPSAGRHSRDRCCGLGRGPAHRGTGPARDGAGRCQAHDAVPQGLAPAAAEVGSQAARGHRGPGQVAASGPAGGVALVQCGGQPPAGRDGAPTRRPTGGKSARVLARTSRTDPVNGRLRVVTTGGSTTTVTWMSAARRLDTRCDALHSPARGQGEAHQGPTQVKRPTAG
jgi:hypothetical protein